MAGHAQLKFVMTECSKTQIRLTGLTMVKTRCSSFRIIIAIVLSVRSFVFLTVISFCYEQGLGTMFIFTRKMLFRERHHKHTTAGWCFEEREDSSNRFVAYQSRVIHGWYLAKGMP